MPAAAPEPEYITVKEAAALAGVHIMTVNRWLHRGLFEGKRKDRRGFLVHKAEFERYLAELTAPIGHSTA